MMNKKISVAMTTYNGEQYINQQIESIINQTMKPNEIVIYDDCSSDSTIAILKKIAQDSDIEFKININKKNVGYKKNFRNAILNTKGKFIFLCDQDDIWEKNKIEKTIKIMEKNDVDVACTGFFLIDENGKKIEDLEKFKSAPLIGYQGWKYKEKLIPMLRLVFGNFSPGCTYCFKRNILETYKNVNKDELSHDFQLLLIGANENKAIFIDEPLSSYRIHKNNTIGMSTKEKKRKRHIVPKISRFLFELSKYAKVKNKIIINLILFFRIPKIRAMFIEKFNLKNELKF